MKNIVKIIAVVAAFGVTVISASSDAQARFGAEAIANASASVPSAQPVQYYRGYRSYRPYYAPRYYRGGYYSDYRRYGYPGSRDALATCAYC